MVRTIVKLIEITIKKINEADQRTTRKLEEWEKRKEGENANANNNKKRTS